MSTTNILDLNNRIDKIEKAGIGTAAETSYSNTTSGLTATNVQSAIDELDGVTDNMASSITDIEGDILAIEGDVEDLEKGKVDWTSEGILGSRNLIINPLKSGESVTINDVTFTAQDDGSIIANGTSSAATNFVLNTATRWKKGAYIISGGHSSDKRVEGYLNVSPYNQFWKSETEPYQFTLEEDKYPIRVRIRIESGVALDNERFYPMLRLASVEDATFVEGTLSNNEITDRLKCSITTDGTYTLKATVSNGVVTYAWTLDT